MRATRDRRVNDPIYLQYLDDLAKEQAAIKAEQDALADQTPEAMYERAADAEAQTILELLRTGYVPESVLPVERINGRSVVQSAKINNFKWFAENEPNFERWMAEQLIDCAFRNDIVPVAPNYKKLHELMLQCSAYEEPAQPVAQPEVEKPEQVLTPSQLAEQHYMQRRTNIVVHDPVSGKDFTEYDLEHNVDSKTELRLRRLMEGRIGNEQYDEFLSRKDWQAAEAKRIAALGEEQS